MKISQLKINPTNPRVIKDDSLKKLAESIKSFPEMMEKRPMVCVTDDDGKIYPLGGNMRLVAIKDILSMTEIPDNWILMADEWTDEQRNEFIIKDNVSFGEWDLKELSENWNIDDLDKWGLDIKEMNIKEKPVVLDEDNFDIDENIPEKPNSKLGDIFELGRHRLVCGDATIPAHIDVLMNGKMADCYITDPPYNVNYEGATKDKLKIENDKQSSEEFQNFLYKSFNNANSVMKEGASFYIWHASSEEYNFISALNKAEFKLRQILIWVKNTLVLGRQDYQWKHEPCLYGWKDGAAHYFINDRTQTTVLEEDKPQRSSEHPTMKPVKLIGRIMKNSTKKNDIVLDNFGGSGTTLIAAEQLGRTCYMMELDPIYCDVIIKRWEEFTQNKARYIGNFLNDK